MCGVAAAGVGACRVSGRLSVAPAPPALPDNALYVSMTQEHKDHITMQEHDNPVYSNSNYMTRQHKSQITTNR